MFLLWCVHKAVNKFIDAYCNLLRTCLFAIYMMTVVGSVDLKNFWVHSNPEKNFNELHASTMMLSTVNYSSFAIKKHGITKWRRFIVVTIFI